MLAASAKDYYTFPIYPLLFAAGSVAWERVFGAWRRSWHLVVASACLALATVFVITFPTFIPTFTPAGWLRYTAKHDLYSPPSDLSNVSPLPPFFADRFGWQEEALSGQNSFYLWGFGRATGKVVLYITGRQPDDLRHFYGEVTMVGTLNHSPYMLAAERNQQIYLLRDPHQDMLTFWRTVKVYI